MGSHVVAEKRMRRHRRRQRWRLRMCTTYTSEMLSFKCFRMPGNFFPFVPAMEMESTLPSRRSSKKQRPITPTWQCPTHNRRVGWVSIRKKHQRGKRKEENNGVRVAALIIAFSWSCKQRYHSKSWRQRRPCYKEATVGIVESRTARFKIFNITHCFPRTKKCVRIYMKRACSNERCRDAGCASKVAKCTPLPKRVCRAARSTVERKGCLPVSVPLQSALF